MFYSLFLTACTSVSSNPTDQETPGDDDDTSPTQPGPDDTGTPPTTPTGDTAPDLPTFDCDTIPLQPLSTREVPGARGYHDVAFDDDGYLIGSASLGDLLRVDHDGNSQVFVPNLGTTQQFAWLPDGDLAVATDNRGIVRVAPTGGYTVLNGSISAWSLVLGPDGMLYSANQRVVHRIDPDSGDAEVILPQGALERGQPRVIAFDRAYERLIVGTSNGRQGRLYAVPLDANLDPSGPPTVLATGVGNGAYHDAIAVDLCGYLYVADYGTSALYRVHPTTGDVQTLMNVGLPQYGHGIEFGNGVGGWLETALYLPRPYANNKVNEVDIGVPSRDWPGLVPVNLP